MVRLEDDASFELEPAIASEAGEMTEGGRIARLDGSSRIFQWLRWTRDGGSDRLFLSNGEGHLVRHIEAVNAQDELPAFGAELEAALQRGIQVVVAGAPQVERAPRRITDRWDGRSTGWRRKVIECLESGRIQIRGL